MSPSPNRRFVKRHLSVENQFLRPRRIDDIDDYHFVFKVFGAHDVGHNPYTLEKRTNPSDHPVKQLVIIMNDKLVLISPDSIVEDANKM